ncbi:MAG: hypothetical protein ACRDA4_09595 [Filifactoraceae bacterium]
MNIINRDLEKNQFKEVEAMISESINSLGKRCDLILVLSDGINVLLVKRDNQIIVQTLSSLEF